MTAIITKPGVYDLPEDDYHADPVPDWSLSASGAKLLLEGKWKRPGVWNVEQLDPDPFMAEIGRWGLPWVETAPEVPLPI